ncbi:hypothetical protein BKA56DRAFT_617722 [Ilyonectria sp. MPI-CAGE-AT-0026]|nr:hypothetical protein BKA56DRAFT_617722 [Ilyonectria sp. MPI-CAGE-AT-0026]
MVGFISKSQCQYRAYIKETLTKVFAFWNVYSMLLSRRHVSKAFKSRYTTYTAMSGFGYAHIVQGIILTDGLGRSSCLCDYLQVKMSKRNINGLHINGMKVSANEVHLRRTTICQGAVCRGFADGSDGSSQIQARKPLEIKSTVSRPSYGIKFRTKFVKGKHLDENTVEYNVDGKWVADNQMEWYLTKWLRLFELDCDGCFSVTVCEYEDDEPPSRETSTVKKFARLSVRSYSMTVVKLQKYLTLQNKEMEKMYYNIRMFSRVRGVGLMSRLAGLASSLVQGYIECLDLCHTLFLSLTRPMELGQVENELNEGKGGKYMGWELRGAEYKKDLA